MNWRVIVRFPLTGDTPFADGNSVAKSLGANGINRTIKGLPRCCQLVSRDDLHE
jgi:hypothetical protein